MLRLSVLDQSPIPSGSTGQEAIGRTLELAALCDSLGYHRYWLAEHHNSEALAGTAPEVLAGMVATRTSRIRVGSGGVMLSHYSPLHVAECFRILAAVAPGRVDLGIGRAPGTDGITAYALTEIGGRSGEHFSPERFPHAVAELQRYLRGERAGHHGHVVANPGDVSVPALWLLGSSDQSAAVAAHFGAAFSFAHFINPQGGPEVMEAYRHHFRPSPDRAAAEGLVAIFALAADTAEEAERLARSRDLFLLRLHRGEQGPYPSPEEAAAYPYSDQERLVVRANRQRGIVGTPDKVKAGIERLGALYGVEEVMVVTITHDFAARRRSYELLAQTFGLS